MNRTLYTVLLTILALSVFVIALVELSGVSNTAIVNRYKYGYNEPYYPYYQNGYNPHGYNPHSTVTLDKEEDISNLPKTKIEFYQTRYNFGTITEGDVVKHAFRFKNIGVNPLVIGRADVSCGCTVPTYSKVPIPPGGEGEVTIQYNSAGHSGHQQKNVLIHSNSQRESMSIGFDADVIPK